MRKIYNFRRTATKAMKTYKSLERMENVGVVTVEAACIAEAVFEAANEKTSIVTFSLGSGKAGDVIMSFVADICGEQAPLAMWWQAAVLRARQRDVVVKSCFAETCGTTPLGPRPHGYATAE